MSDKGDFPWIIPISLCSVTGEFIDAASPAGNGAYLNAVNSEGVIALHVVIRSGHKCLARDLSPRCKSDTDRCGWLASTSLHCQCRIGGIWRAIAGSRKAEIII
ncbi:hypothetical protein BDV23DRAFT_160304 [Aspergillus alliaceus]|uniref:Uncharacterized protein n=1 Tax=Petromyces alliaceus TaxID=209559 RepID=A0A5N7C1V0_PETAA|nr:hypothetical protein BDV23DRAFT_160304 [Aspergillus alliaceus]